MNLKEFEKWALDKKQVGNPTKDESYKGECVSLVQQYLSKVHNIPFKARGNAKDWVNITIEGFKKYSPDNPLKAGDIIVYTKGQYGHMAIITVEGKSLEQNKNENRIITVGSVVNGYAIIHRPIKIDLGVQEIQNNQNNIDKLAQEVIAGKYGNGDVRKEKLGSLYDEVQKRVNEILSGKVLNKKSNQEIAKEVIDGKWGNGNDRKNKLESAGYNYLEIQTIVNKLLS